MKLERLFIVVICVPLILLALDIDPTKPFKKTNFSQKIKDDIKEKAINDAQGVAEENPWAFVGDSRFESSLSVVETQALQDTQSLAQKIKAHLSTLKAEDDSWSKRYYGDRIREEIFTRDITYESERLWVLRDYIVKNFWKFNGDQEQAVDLYLKEFTNFLIQDTIKLVFVKLKKDWEEKIERTANHHCSRLLDQYFPYRDWGNPYRSSPLMEENLQVLAQPAISLLTKILVNPSEPTILTVTFRWENPISFDMKPLVDDLEKQLKQTPCLFEYDKQWKAALRQNYLTQVARSLPERGYQRLTYLKKELERDLSRRADSHAKELVTEYFPNRLREPNPDDVAQRRVTYFTESAVGYLAELLKDPNPQETVFGIAIKGDNFHTYDMKSFHTIIREIIGESAWLYQYDPDKKPALRQIYLDRLKKKLMEYGLERQRQSYG